MCTFQLVSLLVSLSVSEFSVPLNSVCWLTLPCGH